MVKPCPSTSGWWGVESRQTLRANVFQRKILKNDTLRIEKVGILNPCLTPEYIFSCEEKITNKPLINRLSGLSWTALRVLFRSLIFLSNMTTRLYYNALVNHAPHQRNFVNKIKHCQLENITLWVRNLPNE